MKKINFTSEQDELIVSMREAQKSWIEIEEALGIGYNTLRRRWYQLNKKVVARYRGGNKKTRINWTPEIDAAILAGLVAGKNWRQLGIELGHSRNTILARGQNLALPTQAKQINKQNAKPYEVKVSVDVERRNSGNALPPGHPYTWGLLTKEPYPQWR